MDNTIQMYHGGKRWSYKPTEILPSKKNKYEGGPGIYFTNNYLTARKYAKGSRVVHLVNIDSTFTDIDNVKIDVNEFINDINNLHGLRNKKDIINDIKRYAERTSRDKVSLSILNNLVINYEAGAGKIGPKLAKYFASKGADASIMKQSNGEIWLVVFNPEIIKKVSVTNPSEIDYNNTIIPFPR